MAAVDALGGFQTPDVEQSLLELLKHRDNKVKLRALQALKRRNTPKFHEILRPLVKSRSKMVLREIVGMLFEEGQNGRRILADNAPKLISTLYKDRPSRRVAEKLLTLDDIKYSSQVHELYAKQIDKQAAIARRVSNTTGSSWYWRRRADRYRQQLNETIRLVQRYFANPLPDVLEQSIIKATRTIQTQQTTFYT